MMWFLGKHFWYGFRESTSTENFSLISCLCITKRSIEMNGFMQVLNMPNVDCSKDEATHYEIAHNLGSVNTTHRLGVRISSSGKGCRSSARTSSKANDCPICAQGE